MPEPEPEPIVAQPEQPPGTVRLGTRYWTERYIGDQFERFGVPLLAAQEDRLGGTYVLGRNGSGKSSLLLSLVCQDLAQGMGLCVLDPHGDLIARVLERIPPERAADVVLLDARARNFGLNLFSCPDPGDEAEVMTAVTVTMETFQKMFSTWGYVMARVLRAIAYTLTVNPGATMSDIPALLGDRTFRSLLTDRVHNPVIRGFWDEYERMTDTQRRELLGSSMNKIEDFLLQPTLRAIIGADYRFDFRRMMDEGKVLLISLPSSHDVLGEDGVRLLGTAIVGQIVAAALSRNDTPPDRRRQFNFYCDEYHRFATEYFAKIFVELRKYGLALTIAHQGRWQLDEANRGAALNANILAIFSVDDHDAAVMARNLKHGGSHAWLADALGQQERLHFLAKVIPHQGPVRQEFLQVEAAPAPTGVAIPGQIYLPPSRPQRPTRRVEMVLTMPDSDLPPMRRRAT